MRTNGGCTPTAARATHLNWTARPSYVRTRGTKPNYPRQNLGECRLHGPWTRRRLTPWLHVLYSEQEVEDALAELVLTVDARFAYLHTVPEDDAAIEYETMRYSAHGALATIAHLVKSPGFVGEKGLLHG